MATLICISKRLCVCASMVYFLILFLFFGEKKCFEFPFINELQLAVWDRIWLWCTVHHSYTSTLSLSMATMLEDKTDDFFLSKTTTTRRIHLNCNRGKAENFPWANGNGNIRYIHLLIIFSTFRSYSCMLGIRVCARIL